MTDVSMFEHKGWKLATAFEDKEPRIKDVELGERLGYAQPIAIRKLIRSLCDAGKLSNVAFLSEAKTNPEGRGRPGKAFYLTEIQAVIVITNSGTPTANALTQEIAEVFVAWRHGRLGGVDEQRIAALIDSKIAGALAVMQELMMRLLTERAAPVNDGSTITQKQYDELSDEIETLAMLECAAGDWPERPRRRPVGVASADKRKRPRTPVERAMAGIRSALADNTEIGWGRKGRPWRTLPVSKLHAVKAVLAGRLVDVRRKLGGMENARRALAAQDGQLDIFEMLATRKRSGTEN